MEFAATFEYLVLGVADRTSPLHQDAPWPGSSRGEWIWTTSQMISASAYITSSRAANCPMTAPRRSQDARQLAKPGRFDERTILGGKDLPLQTLPQRLHHTLRCRSRYVLLVRLVVLLALARVFSTRQCEP